MDKVRSKFVDCLSCVKNVKKNYKKLEQIYLFDKKDKKLPFIITLPRRKALQTDQFLQKRDNTK